MPDQPLLALDLLLRGGGCTLALVLAALLLRDHGRVVAAQLGALFAVGAAAYTLCASSHLHSRLGWWGVPVVALASGNSLVLWLFARALFDDSFRMRKWYVALWLAIVAAGSINGFVLEPGRLPLAVSAGRLLAAQALVLAVMAGAQSVKTWQADLIEPRRRLRLFIVIAAAGYTMVTAMAGIIGERTATPAASLIEAGVLLAIAATVACSLLRIASDEALFGAPSNDPATGAAVVEARRSRAFPPADERSVAALERAMRVDRLYRQEGLTIGRLAQLQNMPEYKLRRLINQHLGYRNFTSFLNHYRLADAKAALADPSQEGVPILTIALDAGFSSLGPFNRAFKTDTGVTPSEYRQSKSEIRQPSPVPAGRISNPA